MAPEERTEIVQELERSRQELLAALSGMDEAQAKARPDAERWSVLECVEHITIVEEYFFAQLEKAEKLDAPRINKEHEARLMAGVPDRSTRRQAPEMVRPSGRFATLAEALVHFNTRRERSIQFAQDRAGDLYYLTSEHPRFGTVNGVEWLIFIAGHGRRHTAQIQEIRAGLQAI
jgi:uncharacterized damage-inducible protein DinB